ncbi:MAG: hypothetical protein LBQ03_01475 [Puniceicoccales bacterium]|jgi:hypothetical protein|nr:hypothetical protein [Puniceicoccales bacterium]
MPLGSAHSTTMPEDIAVDGLRIFEDFPVDRNVEIKNFRDLNLTCLKRLTDIDDW